MASKKTPKPAAATTQQQLALQPTADNALSIVASTSVDAQAALIEAWLGDKHLEAIAAIARADEAPANARKAARRAVAILKARGVVIPERPHVANVVVRPEIVVEARMSFPDADGLQLWWITRAGANGSGLDLIELTTSDRQGIVQLQRASTSAGAFRQHLGSMATRTGRAPVEVPLAYARRRLGEGLAALHARKAVPPMGLDAVGGMVGRLEDAPVVEHPLVAAALAVPTDAAVIAARVARSQALHSEPEFRTWLPEAQAGVPMLQAIDGLLRSFGPAPEQPKAEMDTALNAIIDEAADAYFDGTRKALARTRFADAAWSLHCAGRDEQAIDALLVAAAIERAGIVSDRPSEIPFVRAMFLKLIALAQERARQKTVAQQRAPM